ncbi:MAG TPA: alanine racemase [Oxalicibacterium sp.]|nr:alanine racemase [Oxalicibacterium sp.]
MPRPLVATIDIAALRHNLHIAKQHAPKAKAWAVVKANAYGHGLERGMRGFAEADGLAMIEPEAAANLRELGWSKRLLLLEGVFDMQDLALAVQHRVDLVVHNKEQLAMIESSPIAGSLDVWLKVNSGMNRLGFVPSACRGVYERLRALPQVRSIAFMTHFANADQPDHPGLPLNEQLRRFSQATENLSGERTLSNSAADLLHPGCAADWVRPGVMLYGSSPSNVSARNFDLRPAMQLESEIIGVQHIAAGESVGYGSQFIAEHPMTIGIVACGYADGYPRHAPTGTPLAVDGVRTRVLGRVSMDMMSVDLTPVANARVGSKVELWGSTVPIDEVAHAAGTLGYELMCAVAPRVKIIER